MRHSWVFDVLRDLQSYAIKNDLPALAARVDEALAVAKAEIAAAAEAPSGTRQTGSGPEGRAH